MKIVMRHRIVTIILMLVLCLNISSSYVLAKEETNLESIVEPRNIAINNCLNSLSMDTPGVLTCAGATTVKPGYTARVIVELQYFDDGDWTTDATWSDNGGMSASVEEDYTATKGNTYRLRLSHLAYNASGNLVEMIPDYSILYSY